MAYLSITGLYPIALIRAADFTLTTDQPLTWLLPAAPANYIVRRVVAVRKSGAFGAACLGGLYTAASKGGNALVAATQTWAGLTIAGTCVDAGLAAIATSSVTTAATLYLSLTTGNTGALTGDVLVYGDIVV
jgi:hypothetical protein